MIKKIVLSILFVMLLGFVLVQYNDPDPIIWMPLYGWGAALVLMGLLGRYNRWLIWISMALYFTMASFYLPSMLEWIDKEHGRNLMQKMDGSKMYIEETREFGGLIIVFLVMVVLNFFRRDIDIKNGIKQA